MQSVADERRGRWRLNIIILLADNCRRFVQNAQMRHAVRSFVSSVSVAAGILASGPASGATHEHALTEQVAAAPTAESAAAEPGDSFDTAIVLEGAKNELSGVEAENCYIAAHFPGWRQQVQALLNHNGRAYDRIDIVGPKGETKSLYFDITDWFGKPN